MKQTIRIEIKAFEMNYRDDVKTKWEWNLGLVLECRLMEPFGKLKVNESKHWEFLCLL
jgi:hypothetical protein